MSSIDFTQILADLDSKESSVRVTDYEESEVNSKLEAGPLDDETIEELNKVEAEGSSRSTMQQTMRYG